VIAHSNHLVGPIDLKIEGRVIGSHVIGLSINRTKPIIPLDRQVTQSGLKVRGLRSGVCAVRYLVLIVGIVGGYLVGIIYFDLPSLRRLIIHVGSDAVNVPHPYQIVNACRARRRGRS